MENKNTHLENENLENEKSQKLELTTEYPLTPEKENQISERFKFLWEQYTKIVNLCITLSVGTLLIFANNIFTKDNIEKFKIAVNLKYYAISSVSCIFLGLLLAILWRILSQNYMEKEVFGRSNVIKRYLKDANIYDHSYTFEEKPNKIYRWLWKISQILTFISLLIGWLLFLLFYFNFLWI